MNSLASETSLAVNDLSVTIGNKKLLSAISLQFNAGDLVALIGPNGSGKSTFLKAISRVLNESWVRRSGSVYFGGVSFEGCSLKDWVKKVSYVGTEFTSDFPITALEAVATAAALLRDLSGRKSHEALLENVMKRADCWQYRNRELSTLSSGERQCVAVAKALIQNAHVILFDETFSQMDLDRQAKMGALLLELAKEGKVILYVSHDMNFATEWAEKVILLKDGAVIAEGSLKTTLTRQQFEKLYDPCLVALTEAEKPKVRFKTK